MADSSVPDLKQKPHRARNSGVKADKKKLKSKKEEEAEKQKNPKAFAINSVQRAERRYRRKEDITAKRQHIPLVDKTPEEPPPILIAVVGPPKVGKSTLINNLIKSFTKTNVTTINGPITIVTSKKRRITLIECNNDINCMIDIAKCADLVLLMCDASFGFEMEIFEFLNICQVHGMPKIMGILTHLDMIKNVKTLKTRKKELKHRFWTEVYSGAKLFYLSGILHGEYLRNEVKNLGRFISVIKYRPLTWRGAHSYVLADRMEDITNLEEVRVNPKCDREIVLYGYIRGVPMNKESMVHIAGYGDIRINELSALPDPCPLPNTEKKRDLLEKERLLYAPMSGVGGIVYDKDAVYIELQGSHHHKSQLEEDPEKHEIVQSLIERKETIDTQIDNQEFKLFSDGNVIKSSDFKDEQDNSSDDDDDDDNEESSDDENKDSGMDDQESDNEDVSWKGSDTEKSNNLDNDDSSDEEYDDPQNVPKIATTNQSDSESDRDDNILHNNMSWKEGLAKRARDSFLERQSNTKNLMKLVYGVFTKQKIISNGPGSGDESDDDDDSKLGGLFKIVSKEQETIQKEKTIKDQDENCFIEQYANTVRNWLDEENKNMIKNCFVTGKWKKSEDAEELLKLDDLSDADSEVYGDFEDFETGTKHTATENASENKEDEKVVEDENSRKRKMTRVEEENMNKKDLMAKKMKLKAKFDSEYDNPDKSERITGDHKYYEALKAEALRQTEINKSEFSNLDETTRIEIEGFRAGLYIRMGFKNIPCEFVNNFNPTYPMLIGGLNMAEENIGYVACKVKKHRWYKKILKTADPLIISLGWRRFQTIPIYSKIEDNLKLRYLKYTPNHVTCCMTFYGPITPQNTGFLAVQSVSQNNNELKRLGFRISATGCVIEMDKSTQIMKKLKLVGTPYKIYKKTAFIKGMFTSELEVAKFESAKIKTVSGIRGTIKKAERTPNGAFRATFEDKILISDIVFCRTWFNVDVPKFYTPVTSLLLPENEKSKWLGMKTVGQLKREKEIKNQPNQDSLYTKIKREEKQFRPLVIPKSLQKSLPYKDKPKLGPLNPKKSFDSERVAVILSPHEQKVSKMMKMIKTNYDYKQEKQKVLHSKQIEKFKKEKEAEEFRKMKRRKELKKKVFRTLSKMDIAKSAKAGGK